MTPPGGLALVCLYLALVKGAGNILFIVLQSGFFKSAGVVGLPYVYAALNVGYICVQAAFIQRLKARSARCLRSLVWALLAVLALRFALPPEAGPAVAAAGLLCFMGFDLLFNQFFVAYVNEIFPLQQGKANLPILNAASSAAFILSGLSLRMALAIVSPRTMLLTAGSLLLAAQACFHLLRHRFVLQGEGLDPLAEAGKAQSPGPSEPDVCAPERHLGQAMVAMAFFTMSSKYLLDYLYSKSITGAFASEAELASFIAAFTSSTDLIVVASQLVVAGPTLRRIGIAAALGIMPAAVLAASVGSMLWGGFAWVLATQFLYTYLAKTFHTPAASLLLPVLPGATRLTVMSRTGMASAAGSLLVSLGLVAFQGAMTPIAAFAVLALLLVGILGARQRIAAAYPESVRRALGRGEPEVRESLAEALETLDPSERARELGRLLEGDEGPALEAIGLAAALGPACLEALLLPLRGRPLAPRVLSGAVRALAELRSAAARGELLALLADPSVDGRVRADLAEAIGRARFPAEAREPLRALLAADEPRLAASAAGALVELAGDPVDLRVGLATLRDMLGLERGQAADPSRRAAALAALGRTRHVAFVAELAACLDDSRKTVARQAADALAAIGGSEAAAVLAGALEQPLDPARAALVARSLAMVRASLSASTRQVLQGLGESERAAAAGLLGRLGDPDSRRILDRVLRLDEIRVRRALTSVLANPGSARAVERLLVPDLEGHRFDSSPLEAALTRGDVDAWADTRTLLGPLIAGGLPAPAVALLSARLAWLETLPAGPETLEAAELAADLAREPARVRQAFAALRAPDPFQASLAEELIQLQLPRRIASPLVALLRRA